MLLADAKAWPTLCGPGFFLGCVLQPLELAGPSAGRRGYDARSHATKKAQFRAFFVCSELLSGADKTGSALLGKLGKLGRCS